MATKRVYLVCERGIEKLPCWDTYIDNHKLLQDFFLVNLERIINEDTENVFQSTCEQLSVLADSFTSLMTDTVFEILWVVDDKLPHARRQYQLYGTLKRWRELLHANILLVVRESDPLPAELKAWASLLNAGVIMMEDVAQLHIPIWTGTLHVFQKDRECTEVPNIEFHLQDDIYSTNPKKDKVTSSSLQKLITHEPQSLFLEFMSLLYLADVPEFYISQTSIDINFKYSSWSNQVPADFFQTLKTNPQLGYLLRFSRHGENFENKKKELIEPTKEDGAVDSLTDSGRKWYEELSCRVTKDIHKRSLECVTQSYLSQEPLHIICYWNQQDASQGKFVGFILHQPEEVGEKGKNYAQTLLDKNSTEETNTSCSFWTSSPLCKEIRSLQKSFLERWLSLETCSVCDLPTSLLLHQLTQLKDKVVSNLKKRTVISEKTVQLQYLMLKERDNVEAAFKKAKKGNSEVSHVRTIAELHDLVNKELDAFGFPVNFENTGPSLRDRKVAALPWPACLERSHFDVLYNSDKNSEQTNDMINKMIMSVKKIEHQSLIDECPKEQGMLLRNRNPHSAKKETAKNRLSSKSQQPHKDKVYPKSNPNESRKRKLSGKSEVENNSANRKRKRVETEKMQTSKKSVLSTRRENLDNKRPTSPRKREKINKKIFEHAVKQALLEHGVERQAKPKYFEACFQKLKQALLVYVDLTSSENIKAEVEKQAKVQLNPVLDLVAKSFK